MKAKVQESKQVSMKVLKNLDELAMAVSFTAVTSYSGVQAFQHRQETVLWSLLLAASIFSVYTSAKAWIKVLNK